MNLHHAREAVKDAVACAKIGQTDTANALIDHAEELMARYTANLMTYSDRRSDSYTAHLTEQTA